MEISQLSKHAANSSPRRVPVLFQSVSNVISAALVLSNVRTPPSNRHANVSAQDGSVKGTY